MAERFIVVTGEKRPFDEVAQKNLAVHLARLGVEDTAALIQALRLAPGPMEELMEAVATFAIHGGTVESVARRDESRELVQPLGARADLALDALKKDLALHGHTLDTGKIDAIVEAVVQVGIGRMEERDARKVRYSGKEIDNQNDNKGKSR